MACAVYDRLKNRGAAAAKATATRATRRDGPSPSRAELSIAHGSGLRTNSERALRSGRTPVVEFLSAGWNIPPVVSRALRLPSVDRRAYPRDGRERDGRRRAPTGPRPEGRAGPRRMEPKSEREYNIFQWAALRRVKTNPASDTRNCYIYIYYPPYVQIDEAARPAAHRRRNRCTRSTQRKSANTRPLRHWCGARKLCAALEGRHSTRAATQTATSKERRPAPPPVPRLPRVHHMIVRRSYAPSRLRPPSRSAPRPAGSHSSAHATRHIAARTREKRRRCRGGPHTLDSPCSDTVLCPRTPHHSPSRSPAPLPPTHGAPRHCTPHMFARPHSWLVSRKRLAVPAPKKTGTKVISRVCHQRKRAHLSSRWPC